MDPVAVLDLLRATADRVGAALAGLGTWAPSGTRPGEAHHERYTHDLAADAAALTELRAAGVSILSEESGFERGRRPLTVVVDPVDGSTNAHRGIPWWCTSLCALDDDGPLAALVVDRVHGTRYEAIRGGGALVDGRALQVDTAAVPPLGRAVIGLGGWPPEHFGWGQFRALGAAALELCAVAAGLLDGFVYCYADELAPWDYLGGALVCAEAGALAVDLLGRDLDVLGPGDRRTIVAARSPALLDELLAARRRWR